MKKTKIMITAIMSFSMISCATAVPTNGQTTAGSTLKGDTTRFVSMMAKVQEKCELIDSIDTEVIRINPVGTGKTPASMKYGSSEERWKVNLCGKQVPYLVTFTPDGAGGTFFSTAREK